MEVDMNKIRILAESAERRAKDAHIQSDKFECIHNKADGPDFCQHHASLNDFFYWSGKATSYRGIIAMAELQQIVEDELDAEGSCP